MTSSTSSCHCSRISCRRAASGRGPKIRLQSRAAAQGSSSWTAQFCFLPVAFPSPLCSLRSRKSEEQQCPDSPGSEQGKQHSHGTWHAGGRWRNKGKRGQRNMWKTCAHRHDTAAVPTLLYVCTMCKCTFKAGAGRLWGRFTNRNLSLACDTCTLLVLVTFYALWVKHLQKCLLLLVRSTTGRARKDVVVAKCRTQHCPEECNDKNWKSELPKINCLCLRAGTAKRGTLSLDSAIIEGPKSCN